jgi:hypothetical protein
MILLPRPAANVEIEMSEWDDDISTMALTDIEKNGLQAYRNYQRAFEAHAERQFAKEIDAELFSASGLERVLELITISALCQSSHARLLTIY